jgi:hypothetical protein
LAATPLPTAELEEWRYSRIDTLDLDRYQLVAGPGAVADGATTGSESGLALVADLISAMGSGLTLIEPTTAPWPPFTPATAG